MKARILVIEDEMSINDLLCMNLEIAGYETVGYLDGNEAYEAIIQDHAFQCALVDIMLPGRDGYSLLPKLKQYEIPVISLIFGCCGVTTVILIFLIFVQEP